MGAKYAEILAYARGLEEALVALAGPRKAEAFFSAAFENEGLRPARARTQKIRGVPKAYLDAIEVVRRAEARAAVRRAEKRIVALRHKWPGV